MSSLQPVGAATERTGIENKTVAIQKSTRDAMLRDHSVAILPGNNEKPVLETMSIKNQFWKQCRYVLSYSSRILANIDCL
jgi:hypothetical protein